MRYLADTALVLYIAAGRRLSPRIQRLTSDSDATFYASAASAYEIANKYRLGKLPVAFAITNGFERWVATMGFDTLPLTAGECTEAGLYLALHRDPFDRLLAAQARHHAIPILSPDTAFDTLGVERIW